jgi:hypothetical protein
VGSEPAGEIVTSQLTLRPRRRIPDLPELAAHLGHEFWDFVDEVEDPVIPAALVAGIGEDLRQCGPEPERATPACEERCFEAAVTQRSENLDPRRGALAITELHGQEFLSTVLASADDHEQAGMLRFGSHPKVVGSDQGAVAASRPLRLPGPPSEPDVRVATHPALHDLMSPSEPLILLLARSTAKGSSCLGSGTG